LEDVTQQNAVPVEHAAAAGSLREQAESLTILVSRFKIDKQKLGRLSRRIEIIVYTLTVFFHSIPGVTESLTRLPPEAPIAASQEASIFPVIYGISFVISLVGVTLQIRWLKEHGGEVVSALAPLS
jgi:hypothetical protein